MSDKFMVYIFSQSLTVSPVPLGEGLTPTFLKPVQHFELDEFAPLN
jgi:hypothetical protein